MIAANPEEPATEVVEMEPAAIMPPVSATGATMATVSAVVPSASTLLEPALQPATLDAEVVPTMESPHPDQ